MRAGGGSPEASHVHRARVEVQAADARRYGSADAFFQQGLHHRHADALHILFGVRPSIHLVSALAVVLGVSTLPAVDPIDRIG